jgi:hypothetical protein
MPNRSLAKIASYEEANRECARIIAADPKRYPEIMQEWAHMVLNPPRQADCADADGGQRDRRLPTYATSRSHVWFAAHETVEDRNGFKRSVKKRSGT